MAGVSLGKFEFQILAILAERPSDAYGVAIMDRLRERSGSSVSVGAVYTSLDRLEKKGFVSSAWGDKTPERGGRRKRYYKIEAPGQVALRSTHEQMMRFAPQTGFAMGVSCA